MHTQRIHSSEARSLGASSEVWFHLFSSPPFGSPFILSPSHTSVFFFSFMSSCLHVLSSHPFLCLRVHRSCPSCVRAHLLIQVLGRRGLDNEVGFIGCPCALGFSFIATTHTFVPSRPPSHVLILFLSLLRAHLHIRPSLNFLPPLREACVCVPLESQGSTWIVLLVLFAFCL